MRLTLLLAVVVLATGCQPGGGSEPAPSSSPTESAGSPAPEPIRVLHWNVAGALLDHNLGQVAVIDALIAKVRVDRPDVISLNEVCGSQNEYLTKQIKGLGYVGNFAGNNRNALCGVSVHKNMGVAVYVAGGAAPGSGNDYAVGQSTACLTSAGRRPIRACSTHLTSPNNAYPESKVGDEVEALVRDVLQPSAQLPMVVAGDLNLLQSDSGLTPLYDRHYELDAAGPRCTGNDRGGRCTFPASNPKKKLDYVFVDKEHFLERADATITGPGTCRILGPTGQQERPCSDHQQYAATAYLRPDGMAPSTPTPTSTVTAEPPMRMQWTLELRRAAANRTDPVAMMAPRWTGTLQVDPAGRVSGTGRLAVIATQFCREKIDVVRFTATQTVTVTGRIDPARPVTRDPSLQLNLVFGPAAVAARSRPVCTPSANRYLVPLRRFLVLRPVRVTLAGQQYGGYDRLDLPANSKQLSLDGYREP